MDILCFQNCMEICNPIECFHQPFGSSNEKCCCIQKWQPLCLHDLTDLIPVMHPFSFLKVKNHITSLCQNTAQFLFFVKCCNNVFIPDVNSFFPIFICNCCKDVSIPSMNDCFCRHICHPVLHQCKSYKCQSSISFSAECHKATLMFSQYWFR